MKQKTIDKGFSLIELVIVVAILAILVGILAPQYVKYVEKSRKAADQENLEQLVSAFKVVAADGRIPAGDYNIKISTDGTAVEDYNYPMNEPARVAVVEVLKEYVGKDFEKTSLKSENWVDKIGSPTSFISAVCSMENGGDVTIIYWYVS